jgi:hypothetical protein
MHRHGSRRCHYCGAVLTEDLETVPYVGPGPNVVELHDVLVLRCTGCRNMTIEVPEPGSLDSLIRSLGSVINRRHIPQLAYEEGRWRVLLMKPQPTE